LLGELAVKIILSMRAINNLIVVGDGDPYITPKGKKLYTYILICSCGNQFKAFKGNVNSGHTKSCGCRKPTHFHGLRDTPIYGSWDAMTQRCTNSNHKAYPNYGGRGIKIYEEWRDFLKFHEWAINNGWAPKMELDRIDNDGNYEPNNCRWVTHSINNRNKRNNRLITYNGETKTLAEWSEMTGLSFKCIQGRIDSLGWTIEKTLTTKTSSNFKYA
jgi:hypothetical protein